MTTDDASSDQGGNQVLSPEAVSPSHNKVKMADIVGLSQTVLKATQKLRRVATVPPTESHIQVLPEVGRTQLSFKGPGCWFMTLEDSAALAGTEKRMKLIPPPIDSVSCPLLFQRADLKLQHNQASQAWLIENSPSGPYLECGIFNRPYMILWDERLIGFAKGIERRVIVPYDDWLRGRFPEMDHICVSMWADVGAKVQPILRAAIDEEIANLTSTDAVADMFREVGYESTGEDLNHQVDEADAVETMYLDAVPSLKTTHDGPPPTARTSWDLEIPYDLPAYPKMEDLVVGFHETLYPFAGMAALSNLPPAASV